MFVSLAHQQRDLEQTIEAAEAAFGRRTKNREPGTWRSSVERARRSWS
jgi:hypothetical protein